MDFKVYTSSGFDKKFEKFPKDMQSRILKIVNSLVSNPFAGKPLGYRFLREKHFDGFRLYFIVSEQHGIVYVISLSSKKDQKIVINTIKLFLDEYEEEIRRLAFRWV